MANNKLLVNERKADIGGFMVGRLLPFRKKRQVGPFTFIDHFGPATLGNGFYVDTDQHPHYGLSTLSYFFEGVMEHKDSTGASKIISAGDVAFMTAGSGVTHSERTPAYLRDGSPLPIHGYQIWVALPKELENMTPRFDFFPSNTIPMVQKDQLRIKVVAGNAFGLSSQLQGYSPLFMVDIVAHEDAHLPLHDQLRGEVAFVIVKGAVKIDDQVVEAGQMLISKTNEQCAIDLKAGTVLMLFGGEPLPEERFLLWNFVSYDKQNLQRAKEKWIAREFPEIEGDDTYIPFPNSMR